MRTPMRLRATIEALGVALAALACGAGHEGASVDRVQVPEALRVDAAIFDAQAPPLPAHRLSPIVATPAPAKDLREQVMSHAPTVILFAAASLIPAAVLMVTAFVRISIVLTLLRQALGSPQVPGNQVLMALALLLTALVMKPQAEAVYTRGIEPFANGTKTPGQAWSDGTAPIKAFMVDQIARAHHESYLNDLYDLAEPPRAGRFEPRYCEEFPLRVVAPAFLLSELTTALWIGFAIYLPFLVIDLVVSAVLSVMGLFMLPPSMIAMPLKLILFVLADGWMLVAGMLLRSFG